MDQIYGPLTLPSGKVIKFRRPKGLDRTNVTQQVQMDQSNFITGTMMIGMYVSAKVVTEVDGKATNPLDFKNLFNDWDDGDVQYYQFVYNEMFGMTEEKQADAKEKAAFLLTNSTSTDGSSSPAPAAAPSTSGSSSTTS